MKTPSTITECFELLDAVMDDPYKEQIKVKQEKILADCHLDLGMYIRNNWLYDKTSPLLKTFRLKGLSYKSVDDVSSFLIKLYWEYLNGKQCSEEDFMNRFKKNVEPFLRTD